MFDTLFVQVKVTAGLQKRVVTVEWDASPAGDIIADSIVALIMHAQSSAASIRLTSKPCWHARDSDTEEDENSKKKAKDEDLVGSRLRFIRSLLKEQFEMVEASYEGCKGTYEIVTDAGLEADVLDDDGKLRCLVMVVFDDVLASSAKISVECMDHKMAANIQTTLQNAITASAAINSKPS
jgi:Pre-mRNA 3'-end-processing endonuclease polyadenylation factor C-term